jgi:thiamine pyrophosphokinase
MMVIHILGGGPADLLPDLTEYDEPNIIWVGVDRGVYTLISIGIQPEIAFGDFDSVTAAELSKIETEVKTLKRYKPEKDETDMEHALNWAMNQGAHTIRLFGATGGRLDHMQANIQLLVNPINSQSPSHIEIIDKKNIICLKPPGTYTLNKINNKKYISFLPVTQYVKGITLEGFKYPLTDCHISIGSTLCISNELRNHYGTFSFTEGILMIVRSSD